MNNNIWDLSGLFPSNAEQENKGIGAQFDRLLQNLELTSSQKESKNSDFSGNF